MASYVKFYSFVEAVCEKTHNLGSDALKLVLSNSAPAQTNTQLSNITQIGNGNGYTTGGAAVSVTTSAQVTGTYTLAAHQVQWTSSTGNMGPFQYVVLYNDTATNDELIAYWDRGAALTLDGTAGDTFTVKFSNANPGTIFTMA